MSRGLNKVQLIGRAGADPEMRFTPNGKPVTTFRLAVNRRRRPDAEQEPETDWFSVICWDRLAEIVDQLVTKGTLLYCEGRLQVRRYTGNDDSERTAVEIVAADVILLSPKSERAEGQSVPARTTSHADDFDDVPF